MSMFKDPKGEKLREMLLKHGTFDQVEVELTKTSMQMAINDEEGAWENDVSLAKEGVLATYIDLVGKKVDKATDLQELTAIFVCGIGQEMIPKTLELEGHYKELLKFQTDAVLDAGTPPS
ncbi:unnamed protein product, partial [Symbiodinium pilosum]